MNPFQKMGEELEAIAEATKFTAVAAPAYRGLKGTASDAVVSLSDEELAKSLVAVTLMLHLLHEEDNARELRTPKQPKQKEQHAKGN